MPSSQRSLRLTDLYRTRLLAIRQRVERETMRRWRALMPRGLDGDEFPAQMAAVVAGAQREAVRATGGYLAAYLSSELGTRSTVPTPDSRRYSGTARDGRPLREAYRTAQIGAKAALKDGKPLTEALDVGLDRALRATSFDTDQAARQALLEAIEADDRFEGWQRAVSGTCGACLGAAGGVSTGLRFSVHPGCKCVSEPVVRNVPNRFPRPTGPALFAAMSVREQDEALGSEAAELVRSGEVALTDLVSHSPMETEDDWLTQRPVEEVT